MYLIVSKMNLLLLVKLIYIIYYNIQMVGHEAPSLLTAKAFLSAVFGGYNEFF